MCMSRAEQKTSRRRRLLLGRGVTASPSPMGTSCSARTSMIPRRHHRRRTALAASQSRARPIRLQVGAEADTQKSGDGVAARRKEEVAQRR